MEFLLRNSSGDDWLDLLGGYNHSGAAAIFTPNGRPPSIGALFPVAAIGAGHGHPIGGKSALIMGFLPKEGGTFICLSPTYVHRLSIDADRKRRSFLART